jgi:hypothetical protein
MGTKLTFKEYLESKNQLREAASSIPKRTAQYNVRKYCKLVVGESTDDKEYINLKPQNKIFVEWLYEDVDDPTVVSIRFDGVKNVDIEEEHKSTWRGERLLKWLSRNAKELA